MDLESAEDFVESFVMKHFKNASPEDKSSLQASALIYIYEKEDFSLDKANLKELEAKLSKDLKNDFGTEQWREIKVGEMRRTTEYDLAREDALSKMPNALKELRTEIQEADAVFEYSREKIREFLPPILFEAFVRVLDPTTEPRWTAEFSDESLKVLCWRATARIKTKLPE
jgi:hypothetical protein